MVLIIFITALYFITITSNAKITTINNLWSDDYSCEWSDCDIIYQNNPSDNTIVDTTPLYHGPYTYTMRQNNIILSRPFECKYSSILNVSFYATFDCLFDGLLNVYINDKYEYDILITNETEELNPVQNSVFQTCNGIWNQIYIKTDDIINKAEQFHLIFSIESNEAADVNSFANIALSQIQIQCTYKPPNRDTFMFGLSFSSFAATIYFGLYVLLLFFIAITVAVKNNYDGIKDFFKTIWKMRSIYAAVLVHLYDTATDIGVMIDWWFLAQDEKRGLNYESIDMASLFWASVAFLVLYRIITVIMVIYVEYDAWRWHDDITFPQYIFDIILAFFDMYIIRTVWVAVAEGKDEPTGRQRLVQLMESVCESLPQVLLQSVFIVRGYNDENLKNNSSVLLVSFSLIASVLSITNKYVWVDTPVYGKKYDEAELKFKCPCINIRWVSRVVYRFSMILVRLISFALIWIVISGVFLPIYMIFTWLYWLILNVMAEKGDVMANDPTTGVAYMKENPKYWMITTTLALVSNAASDQYAIKIGRFIETGIVLALLTTFAFVDDINCGICADPSIRQATSNQYVLLFIMGGWIAFVIETVLACVFQIIDAYGGVPAAAFEELKYALENI